MISRTEQKKIAAFLVVYAGDKIELWHDIVEAHDARNFDTPHLTKRHTDLDKLLTQFIIKNLKPHAINPRGIANDLIIAFGWLIEDGNSWSKKVRSDLRYFLKSGDIGWHDKGSIDEMIDLVGAVASKFKYIRK